jgi:transcriptional regulator of acetoin/glycerol metabolism
MDKTRPEHRLTPIRGSGPRVCLYLVVCGERPLAEGAAFDLAGAGEVVLGRGGPLGVSARGQGQARVDVPDPTMSGEHARLVLRDDIATIEDLGSRNGTRVRGQLVPAVGARVPIGDGDWFVVGRTAFVVRRIASGPAELRPHMPGGAPALATFVPDIARVFQTAVDLAPSRVPILVTGETGTGKDVIAQEIHRLSGRPGRFVAVNCAALPETLVESELFGYRKGAFSDAREDRAGLIRSADRGTLLLDEIGDLPLGSQAKLLRVLQDGQVVALGAAAPVQVDLRVLAATQRGLDELCREGRFRADLLGRLSGFALHMPPLRDRREDLGILIAALLARHAGADAAAFRLNADAICALFERRWSLNVRELERVLQAAVELCREGKEIGVEHLPAEARLDRLDAAVSLSGDDLAGELTRLLRARHGNVSAVARDLGKARMQIHRWMSQFGIDPADFRLPQGSADPDDAN